MRLNGDVVQGPEFEDGKNLTVLSNPFLGKNRLAKAATPDQTIDAQHEWCTGKDSDACQQ